MPASPTGARPDARVQYRIPGRTARSEFRILEHVGKVRKVGRNYVAAARRVRIPGHDRGGDNLAILIQDPRFYKCWAGCTKEMIRAALGHPIRARQQIKKIGERHT